MSLSQEPQTGGIIENEVNTGIVIAGAYADKLRRTLFAQLRDYVKKNKEFAREVARAAGEVNRILYYILVENLRSDKGDAVRVRIKYRFDPDKMKITWDYDTLRIEYFKRQPDEQVNEVARRVLKEKLKEVMEEYATAPSREEAEQTMKEALEGKKEVVEEEKTEEKIEAVEVDLASEIGSVDPIGETGEGGVVFKITDKNGENMGLASLEPRAGEWVVDAVLIHKGKAYRIYTKASRDKQAYMDNPMLVVEEIRKSKPTQISSEDAKKLIEGKMGEII
jgi:hypothetical protein